MVWLWGLAAVLALVVVAVMATPTDVSYSEEVVIRAAPDDIYDHIRFQQRLMEWSAWPSETGSSCSSEGADGAVGARTVFLTKAGERFGYQEVTALVPGRQVELRLHSKGPAQRPVLTFALTAIDGMSTRVTLQFTNQLSRPFNVALRLFGIVRWTRQMHTKDLDGLKRYAEPPHQTYLGEPARALSSV